MAYIRFLCSQSPEVLARRFHMARTYRQFPRARSYPARNEPRSEHKGHCLKSALLLHLQQLHRLPLVLLVQRENATSMSVCAASKAHAVAILQ